MIISKATYNEMLDIINEQRKSIELLKTQNKALNHAKDKLIEENGRLWATLCSKSDVINIDYPDTKGGNVVNTHLDSIDHTSTYPIQRHNDGTQFFRF